MTRILRLLLSGLLLTLTTFSNVRAAVIYVDGSMSNNIGGGTWGTAMKDIQAAINFASPGDEIWVKAGTYLPTLDPDGNQSQRDKTFYLTTKDVKLYGGFAGTETVLSQRNAATNVTTLSGDLDAAGNNDAYHVVLTLNRTNACVIDGFTITDGRANGTTSFGLYSQKLGGGMFNRTSSPTVSNCTFSGNTALNLGGGMYNRQSNPVISNCTFSYNTAFISNTTTISAGGGIYNDAGSATVSNCTFSNNTARANGGGIYNLQSTLVISNCNFTSNTASNGSGGGMCNEGSTSTITGCVFSANAANDPGGAGNGGGIYNFSSSPATITNCVFSANTATNRGGGIRTVGSSLGNSTITSCVFSANTAEVGGGGLTYTSQGNSSSITMRSCTFWNNATSSGFGGGIEIGGTTGGTITNSVFFGNTAPTYTSIAPNREDIFRDQTPSTGGQVPGLTVSYSIVGDYSATASNNYTANNVLAADPLFIDVANPAGMDGIWRTADDGLRIACTSPAKDAGTVTTPINPLTDILDSSRVGTIDRGAYEVTATGCPGVLYVNSSKADNSGNGYSWGSAKKDVQAAINAATAGAEIWVKAGTYLPTLDPSGGTSQRDKTFYIIGKDVKLYGGFAGNETQLSQRNAAVNVTILSGDLDGTSGTADAYHVVLTRDRTTACVIDGFTITGGRANGSSTFGGYNQERGGGIYNHISSSQVNNCTFSANTASYGGGMYSFGGNPAVNSCTFSANTVINDGGGMNNAFCNPSVSSCVFSANTASNGGGISMGFGTLTVSNATFSANTASIGNGGGIYMSTGTLTMSNATFSANTATDPTGLGAGIYLASINIGTGGTITNSIFFGNTTPNNATDANQENISKAASTPVLTVSSSIIGDYSAGAANNYTSGTGIITGNPLFVNAANPAGADSKFLTSDDGLALQGCSPAINAGTGTTPITDILGNNRVGGTIDLGAYEYQSSPTTLTPATVTTTETRTQAAGSTTVFGGCGAAIAQVFSTGATPVAGSITATVYVQANAPTTAGQTPYVRRHYDISPATNAAAATAQLKLYFSQSDFDNYNTVRGTRPSLPINAADVAGHKANVQITQKHGTSATGLPGSYSGSSVLINISSSSVVWNATHLRWEVTFPVTGFSGFFLHTGSATPLPLKLLAFGAQRAGEARNRVEWQTADEEPATRFAVERSGDGKTFSTLGTVSGQSEKGNSYQLYDEAPLVGDNYYRLQIAALGNVDYSQTVVIRNKTTEAGQVTAAPVPATDRIVISCPDRSLQGREAVILDVQGRIMVRVVLAEASVLNVAQWPAGVYLLRLPDGSSLRLVKQ